MDMNMNMTFSTGVTGPFYTPKQCQGYLLCLEIIALAALF